MRDISINLRARTEQRNLIDRAASTLGKNRSDFMLEAACEKTQAIVLDRTFLPWMKKPLRDLPPYWMRRSKPTPRWIVCWHDARYGKSDDTGTDE